MKKPFTKSALITGALLNYASLIDALRTNNSFVAYASLLILFIIVFLYYLFKLI